MALLNRLTVPGAVRWLALLLLAASFGAPANAAAGHHHGKSSKAVAGKAVPADSSEDTPEEGDDGADDPPDDPKKRKPTMDETRRDFQLRAEDSSLLPVFNAPVLPDLSPYTAAALEAKIDRSKPGRAAIGSMLQETAFRTLTSSVSQGFAEYAKRQHGGLRAIFIEGGYVTVPQMARELPKDLFEETSPGIYVVRLPLVIRHGATLHIGPEVKELRLSQDRGVVLANEGTLFLIKSAILGWNEAAGKPSWFHDKHEFRPFIVSWGGSKTYFSSGRVAHLGYANTKAYGLSLTQYGPAAIQSVVWARPTGWILNSEIEDLWYGFYSYEADDVVMRGNTLKNNIKYGYDPHDRSRRLIIADSEVYGTREKHGIIISREVQDSWIINNRTHDNAMSGIMLDRQCKNTVIAGNITFKNGTDGISISESPNNLVWNNLATGNHHHGIRVRNSLNVRIQDNKAIANGLTGVYGNSRSLEELPRDLKLDPYTTTMSMLVVGGELTSNGTGPIGLDAPTSAAFYNVELRAPQRALGFRMGGMSVAFQNEMLDILINKKQVAIIEPRPAQAPTSPPDASR